MTEPRPRRIKLAKKKSGLLGKFNKGNLAKLIFPKLTTIAINLVSIGPRVILRYTFQILRTNIWTRLISTVLLMSFDVYSFARRKISVRQLVINLVLSLTLLIGGSTGWMLGTSGISTIVAENTVLWIVAGLAGAGILSSASDTLCRKILSKFLKSDTEAMVDIINEEFECMVIEYAIKDEQADKIACKVHVDDKICLNCFCKGDKKKYIREILTPYFQKSEEHSQDQGAKAQDALPRTSEDE